MVAHNGQCISKETCDRCLEKGRKDGKAKVDAMHWSGHNPDSPWQEEVCLGRLPSWQSPSQGEHDYVDGDKQFTILAAAGHTEQEPVSGVINDARENALMGDEIEYPCEFDLCEKASETVADEAGHLCLHFDLARCKDEDRSSVEFAVSEYSENLLPPGLVVTRVHPKAALAMTAFGARGLVPGDTVLEVDGRSCAAQELRSHIDEALFLGAWVKLLVKPRPAYFDVKMERKGRFWSRLGVQVMLHVAVLTAGHSEVRVAHVRERGLLPEWNATHGPSQQILLGDRITHVNGISSSAQDVYEAMDQDAVMGTWLHLRVATPPRQATVQHCALHHSPPESTASGSSSLPPSRTSSLGNREEA